MAWECNGVSGRPTASTTALESSLTPGTYWPKSQGIGQEKAGDKKEQGYSFGLERMAVRVATK